MSSTIDELERRLRDHLADLHRRYQAEAEPIIRQLVHIEAMKPLPPISVTLEQAQRLGFTLPEDKLP